MVPSSSPRAAFRVTPAVNFVIIGAMNPLRRNPVTACALALPVAFTVLTGCDEKHDAAPPPPPPTVLVVPVAQRDVAISREWLGTTDGLVNAEVRSRVQGYLIAQVYNEGTPVKKGDLLFEVDPRPFQASLSQAKADLARVQAEQARTQLDVERLAPLAPSGAVSQQEVDNARQSNEANKATIEAAKAALEQAELNLTYTKVTSPIDGVAGLNQSQIGDLVGGPSGPILTTVSTLDPIRVFIPISEQEYLRFTREIAAKEREAMAKGGKKVDLILADGTVFPERGEVDTLNREVDPTTGTIRVAARFPNPGNFVRPGQYARVRAEIGSIKGALLVPQRAVVDLQGVYLVAVVADGKANLRPVKVGERIGSEWVITQGLKAGDQIVVEGVQKVRDGAPVTAQPYVPPKPAEPPPPASPSGDAPKAKPADAGGGA
jgi:RND family efflux transporter MFP subunit